jgi:glyoxylase-like metal-dependent hydrolase (beta-lactamase superfamily II)
MRRIPNISGALAIGAIVLCSCILPTLSQQSPQPMSVQALKGSIYWVEGGGGANAGFWIGPKSVVVVDAKMTAEAAREMLTKIKELTSLPVQAVILTHSDGDHVNGLAGFPAGLTVVSSEGTKAEMEKAFLDDNLAGLRPFLPSVTFKDAKDLFLAGGTIRLLTFGPAHTSGDTVVLFPAERVAFIGDLAFVGRDPLIHRGKGGTSFGLVKTLAAILELEADLFVPGHGKPLAKTEIETLRRSIEEKQAKIKDLVDRGKSLDDVKAAFGIGSETTPPGGRRWPSLVEVIYLDLTEKK